MSKLPMWVIYDHPSDFPDCFVARLWQTLPQPTATAQVITGATADAVRWEVQQLMPGAVRLERRPDDDAKIMEVWL